MNTFAWPIIILQVVAVVTILLFMRVLLHKQLEIGLKRINKLDQDNLQKEAELESAKETLEEEYAAKIKEAEGRADFLVKTAKENAKKIRDTERLKSKEEAKKIIAGALEEKEKVLKQAEHKVYMAAVDFSVRILTRIFSGSELADLRARAAKEVIGALCGSEDVTALLKKEKEVEIVTADKLKKQDMEYISKIIEKQAEKKPHIKFNVDEKVLGGLVLKIGESVIDGSIVRRVNKAAAEVRDEL